MDASVALERLEDANRGRGYLCGLADVLFGNRVAELILQRGCMALLRGAVRPINPDTCGRLLGNPRKPLSGARATGRHYVRRIDRLARDPPR